MRPHEIMIQRRFWTKVYDLMSLYRYNEKVLINEFIDQRPNSKDITREIELKTIHLQKRARSLMDLVQAKQFDSHVKIYTRF